MTDTTAIEKRAEAAIASLPEHDKASLVQVDPARFAKAFDNYKKIQEIIDKRMPDAIMKIQGKPFRKKAYWRAVAVAFDVDVLDKSEEYFEQGSHLTGNGDWGYRVTCVARQGIRQAVGDGTCMASEKSVYDYEWNNGKRGKRLGVNPDKTAENATHHNVRGHAHTRAFNRAVSNLVGFGEVSAEEMPFPSSSEPAARSQNTPKSSPGGSQRADWDGSLPVAFGKYSKPPEGPKSWSEVPPKYLAWVVETMDPAKGPAVSMAESEIQRRAKLEAEPDIVDAEVVQPALDMDGPPPDDPRFR